MAEERNKLVHTFGALAELGREICDKQNFHETVRTSLHLLLGSLGIMRGGVASYSRFAHELNMLAMRGLQDGFPLSLSLSADDERQFLKNGFEPIEVSQTKALPFFQTYKESFERAALQLFIPLVVHEETVGAVFLGQKATGEPYMSSDREVISAMARHIGVAI